MTSGATGAPGERDWTTKIVPMIATNLRKSGVEVYETDAFGNNDKTVTGTDWDLFLAVHYDADIYNDSGGFVDIPDKSVDFSHKESKRIFEIISDHYFKTTKIKNVQARSNANTKFYYMWQSLTAKTPCNIIECGVGWRKPDDYNKLREYDFIAKTLSDAICKALGVEVTDPCEEKLKAKDEEIKDLRKSRDTWKSQCNAYEKELNDANKQIKDLEKQLSQCSGDLQSLIVDRDVILTENNSLMVKIKAMEVESKIITEENFDLKNQIKQLNEKIAKKLEGYSVKELLLAIFRR